MAKNYHTYAQGPRDLFWLLALAIAVVVVALTALMVWYRGVVTYLIIEFVAVFGLVMLWHPKLRYLRIALPLFGAAAAAGTIPAVKFFASVDSPVIRGWTGFVIENSSWASVGLLLLAGICVLKLDYKLRTEEVSVTSGDGPSPPENPTTYLKWLQNDCRYINVRGLQVGSDRANRMPIDKFFIPLSTMNTDRRQDCMAADHNEAESPDDMAARRDLDASQRIDLHKALQNDRLVIVGDPGSGKTTFLRNVAFQMCNQWLDKKRAGASIPTEKSLPILISIAELISYEARDSKVGYHDTPRFENGPGWIAHFAASKSKDFKAELSEKYFEQALKDGGATVLLDGLDEAPTVHDRLQIVKMVEAAIAVYGNCRFVVTSRPAAYRDDVVLNDFAHARIEPLDDEVIEDFLHKWAKLQIDEDKTRADKYFDELLEAVRSRLEIRRLARNAVMLTALAVIHWNEKRLPDYRVELYKSIIMWLARSREQRPGRSREKQCIEYLQTLAYAMQSHPDGRQIQIQRYEAAEAIADSWQCEDRSEAISLAEKFLKEDEEDSGIIVGRGNYIRFWHLTFQEFLAAGALAGLEDKRNKLLVSDEIYQPQWREVILLLAGLLCDQKHERAESMFSAVLNMTGENATLAEQAKCFGLLGEAAGDLLSCYGYKPRNKQYEKMRDAVMGIFDRDKSIAVPINEAIQAAEVLGQSGDTRFAGRAKNPHLIEINGGTFWMGSPEYQVTLSPYLIGQYPVTVEQYEEFVKAKGYAKQQYWKEGGFEKWQQPGSWEEQKQYPNRPVVYVSWFEAVACCAWLTEVTKKDFHLPTEAQWEFAAGGPEKREFAWGNKQPSERLLNFDSNVGSPTPVGIYPLGATPEGICDMSGNVWEWCQDWYGKYPAELVRDPQGPARGPHRVLRGGSWNSIARWARSASRRYWRWNEPAYRYDNLGFRFARGQ